MRIARCVRNIIQLILYLQFDFILLSEDHIGRNIYFPTRKSTIMARDSFTIDAKFGEAIHTVKADDCLFAFILARYQKFTAIKKRIVVLNTIALHNRFPGNLNSFPGRTTVKFEIPLAI
ncbi:hypothetical protein D3C73_691740 [compost metagenome]